MTHISALLFTPSPPSTRPEMTRQTAKGRGGGSREGKRKGTDPIVPLPHCRPQSSGIPKDAGRRVQSETVRETQTWKCITGAVCV